MVTRTNDYALLKQLGLTDYNPEQELNHRQAFLEKRVEQFFMQNEKQEEKIYKQNLLITELCKIIRLLQENVRELETLVREKNQEGEELSEQIERHSLEECILMLESYPASQNDDINTLLLFFYKIYKRISDSDRARLERLGLREAVPAIQFNTPLYDVSENGVVNIGQPI